MYNVKGTDAWTDPCGTPVALQFGRTGTDVVDGCYSLSTEDVRPKPGEGNVLGTKSVLKSLQDGVIDGDRLC